MDKGFKWIKKLWLRRAVKTFVQTLIATAAAEITMCATNIVEQPDRWKVVLAGFGVTILASAIAAVMNLGAENIKPEETSMADTLRDALKTVLSDATAALSTMTVAQLKEYAANLGIATADKPLLLAAIKYAEMQGIIASEGEDES